MALEQLRGGLDTVAGSLVNDFHDRHGLVHASARKELLVRGPGHLMMTRGVPHASAAVGLFTERFPAPLLHSASTKAEFLGRQGHDRQHCRPGDYGLLFIEGFRQNLTFFTFPVW